MKHERYDNRVAIEPRDRFGGLAVEAALRKATECLDVHEYEVTRLYIEGASFAQIGTELGFRPEYIMEVVDKCKVKVAEHQLKTYAGYGHAAALHLIKGGQETSSL